MNYFLPPKPGREDVFYVTFGECSTSYEFRPHIEPVLLNKSGLSIDEFEGIIQQINKVVEPIKEQYSSNEKMIITYVLFGLFIVTTLSIALGIIISFIIPIILTLCYFSGFAILLIRVQKKNSHLLKRIHFNLSLVLRNENDRLLIRHGIKARPGYLSKWIEFHACDPLTGKRISNAYHSQYLNSNLSNGISRKEDSMRILSPKKAASLMREQQRQIVEDEESMFSREVI